MKFNKKIDLNCFNMFRKNPTAVITDMKIIRVVLLKQKYSECHLDIGSFYNSKNLLFCIYRTMEESGSYLAEPKFQIDLLFQTQ